MLIINCNISFILLVIFVSIVKSQRPIPYPISGYGSYQVTLYAGNGNINANSGILYYTFPTIRMQNVQQVGLALCGFNIQNQLNLSYSADVTYSQISNQFNVSIQTFNDTQLAYISFFVLMYGNSSQNYINVRSACLTCAILNNNPNTDRNQTLNITIDYNATLGIQLIYSPYIRSMMASGGTSGYTRLQVSFKALFAGTNSAQFNLYTYQSIIKEACITVVVYSLTYDLTNTSLNLYYQAFSFSVREYNSASLKSQPTNFNISNGIYGPTFNGKCVIGLTTLYFKDGTKEAFFDASNIGLTSITQNTPGFFSATYLVYCTVKYASCNYTYGVNTITQNCTLCTSMISYCSSCNTQLICLACSLNYFIDISGGCCPTYLNNCKTCSLSDVCLMCSSGYYLSQNSTCVSCQSKISNCNQCYNQTKCGSCKSGYTLSSSYTKCNSETSQSSSSSGLSLLQIILIAVSGFLALLCLLFLICLIKAKKNKNPKQNKKPERIPSEQTERRSDVNDQLQIQSASTIQRNAILNNNVDDRETGLIHLKMSPSLTSKIK